MEAQGIPGAWSGFRLRSDRPLRDKFTSRMAQIAANNGMVVIKVTPNREPQVIEPDEFYKESLQD